jgi:hypothetical protein
VLRQRNARPRVGFEDGGKPAETPEDSHLGWQVERLEQLLVGGSQSRAEDRQQEPIEPGILSTKPLGRRDVHRQRFQLVQRRHRRRTDSRAIDERLLPERVASLENLDRDDIAQRPGQADRGATSIEQVDRAHRVTLVEDDLSASEAAASARRPQHRLVQSGHDTDLGPWRNDRQRDLAFPHGRTLCLPGHDVRTR